MSESRFNLGQTLFIVSSGPGWVTATGLLDITHTGLYCRYSLAQSLCLLIIHSRGQAASRQV
jgi:hypothetical protein